jgi:NAD(P)-dependent dehydrogenase (short-subunit alcohol dehydrogenase family)
VQVVNVPQPQTPYNFSKAAVRHMARSLAVEWAHNKIRVNCISPGYVLTNLTKGTSNTQCQSRKANQQLSSMPTLSFEMNGSTESLWDEWLTHPTSRVLSSTLGLMLVSTLLDLSWSSMVDTLLFRGIDDYTSRDQEC